MKKTSWGFDERDIDARIRPQDDFYQYSNGTWLKKNPVPKAESRWGSFMKLRYDTEKQLRSILIDLEKTRGIKKGTPEQLVRDLHRSAHDVKRRNALGAKPLDSYRKMIGALRGKEDLLALVAHFHRIGIGVLWGAGMAQDSKDTTRYLLHFYQSGTSMPDREYYLDDTPEAVRVRTAYRAHVVRMLKLLGYGAKEAERRLAIILDIETKLARVSMNKVDRRDADKTYHKKTVKQFENLAPGLGFERYLSRISAKKVKDVIVVMPEFFTGTATLVDEVPLEDWKVYLEWHVLNDFASMLSERFVKASFAFYGTVLTGVKTMKPLWRRSLSAVNGTFGELLGRVYVKRHFGAEARRKMNVLIDDLFAAYEVRLMKLGWMGPATRKKALTKLRAMHRKIGHPKRWKSYKGLDIDSRDYVGNMVRANDYEHRRVMRKLNGPIDREEWFMFPQTVNAYFDPNMNDIVFPAGILQPPFFDPKADDAVNYGAIGTVIGHEITHGFDDQGSKYDHQGNLKDWWTKDDRERFEKKAAGLVKQFDQYTVADGVKVNGKLTLGENIADLGGAAIAFDAYQRQLARTGPRDIEGRTPEQRFFLAFSVFERENALPEFQKTHALTDPHSPGRYRINGPASNLNEFYSAFGVKEGDALYRDLKDRVDIW